MGYDGFFDPVKMKLQEKVWGVPDQDMMDFAERQLEKTAAPFFASIITMSSHEPFDVPHFPHDIRFDSVRPGLTGRYFGAISYVDRVVGEFVARVQKRYPNTYFFIYGDHTPYVINEGPFRRSALPTEDGMQVEMVPLFIITPDGRARVEDNSIASYLDIAPTVLQVTGVPYRFRSLGIDLMQSIPPRQQVLYRRQFYNRSALHDGMQHFLKDDQ